MCINAKVYFFLHERLKMKKDEILHINKKIQY